MQYEISNRMSDVHGSAIRELFKLGADPNMISFGGRATRPQKPSRCPRLRTSSQTS